MHAGKNTNNKSKHISVVYFHGMGIQRRYEELSRLVDALDSSYRDDSNPRKSSERLVGIQPRIENSRSVKTKENHIYVLTVK